MHANPNRFGVQVHAKPHTLHGTRDIIEQTNLYGISLRLLWLCECGTLFDASLTPQTANSCAEPVKLRSLPRRRAKCPGALPMLVDGVYE